jgi:hypothetical protein
MNAHDAYLRSGFSGEFESEVALPVKVRYAVDADGRVEITHICLAGASGDGASPLLWTHLPMRERWALEAEAEEAARRV